MTDREQVVHEVFTELGCAEAKFPGWPRDAFRGLAIIGEEFGEAQQAALEAAYNSSGEYREHVRQELIQTAAMALRMLLNFDEVSFMGAAGPDIEKRKTIQVRCGNCQLPLSHSEIAAILDGAPCCSECWQRSRRGEEQASKL